MCVTVLAGLGLCLKTAPLQGSAVVSATLKNTFVPLILVASARVEEDYQLWMNIP